MDEIDDFNARLTRKKRGNASPFVWAGMKEITPVLGAMPCQVMEGGAAQRFRFDTGLTPRTAEQGLQMPRPGPTT